MADSGRYIVVFKPHATEGQIDHYVNEVNNSGGQVEHRYDVIFKGFSARIPDQFLQFLQDDDIIDNIEPDRIMTIH